MMREAAERILLRSAALAAALLVALPWSRPAAAQSPAAPVAASAVSLPSTRSLVGPLPGAGELEKQPNPLGGDATARMDGRRYFNQFNCSGCHGGHAGGGMGPSLRDTVWIYGGGDADIFDSIAQGRARGMPAWGAMLPPDVIWRLTAYITSLRSELEPEPPQ